MQVRPRGVFTPLTPLHGSASAVFRYAYCLLISSRFLINVQVKPVFDMGRQWLVACMLLSTVMTVRAYSTGAPAAACARIYTEGHNGTSLSLSSSPFVLDISQLYNQLGNIYYISGYSYTRKISNVYVCFSVSRGS